MKTVKELLSDISSLLRNIETNYPEVYQYLDENPVTIPNMEHPKVSTEDLENYLATLKDLLAKYKLEHKK
jgi:hypothetical protein